MKILLHIMLGIVIAGMTLWGVGACISRHFCPRHGARLARAATRGLRFWLLSLPRRGKAALGALAVFLNSRFLVHADSRFQ